MTLRALTALTGSLLLAACVRHDESTLPGTLERDRVELVADANEAIVSLPFAEGATVKVGDVVVVQDRELSASELDAARAELAEAEARVEELKNGPRSTTIRAGDCASRRRPRAARRRRARTRPIAGPRGAQPGQRIGSRPAIGGRADAAEATLRKPKLTCGNCRKARAPSSSRRRARQPTSARANLQGLETTSARLEVRSPIAGTIDSLPFHLGEKPARGATVAMLLATTAPFARIHVPEPIRRARRSARRPRCASTASQRTFKGQVRFIASEAEFTPYYSLTAADRSRLSFLAEVVIDDSDAASLPSGVPVEVTLDLASP